MKKQSDLSRLMGYAGNYRYFTYASWVLSAVSALVALVPFVYIWAWNLPERTILAHLASCMI